MSDRPTVGNQATAMRPRDVRGHDLLQIFAKAIYNTLRYAIKEAVSNSYDAGAKNVEITFDPPTFLQEQDASELTIQIWDDGMGMTLEDFWEKYTSIGSEKDPSRKNPTTGRYPIGKFGIGSFALIPFSLSLTIYSKKFNERPIKCVVHSTGLLKESADGFPDHVSKNIDAAYITEDEWESAYGSEDAGTLIVVNGVTADTYAELLGGSKHFDDGCKGMFPDAPFTTGLKEIAWELSTLLPLHYADDPGGVSKGNKSSLKSNNKGINITLSEVELRRMIYSRPGCQIHTFDYDEGGVKAKGVLIAIPNGAVSPRQANGVILRLNNVGIGKYQLFGLVGNEGIRKRITGEVHILQGLHGSLNAARDRFSGPAYDKLEQRLHAALAKLSTGAYSAWEESREVKDDNIDKRHAEKHKEVFKKKPKAPPPTPPEKKADPEEQPKGGKKQEGGKKPEAPSTTPPVKDPEPTGGTSTPPPKEFKDPVVDVRHATGEVRFDEGHALFKKFKNKLELRTMKLVLRALHLADVAPDAYQRIVETLLDLK